MTDAQVIAAIRKRHLSPNVFVASSRGTFRWDLATVDPGGTLAPGPYLHVPVEHDNPDHDYSVRIYAPADLRRRLAEEWENMRYPAHRCRVCNPVERSNP